MKNALVISIIFVLSILSTSQAEVRYTITDLGTLGGDYSGAYGINDNGQIVGKSNLTVNGYNHAFLYDGTSIRELDTLGAVASFSQSINNSGQYVITRPSTTGLIYDGISIRELGTLGGDWSEPYDINNKGQVVGRSPISGNSSRYTHAFFYDGTTMNDLGTLEGGTRSWATAINDNGEIVGASFVDRGYHAFYYNGTTMIDLGTFASIFSAAEDINNNGTIVGWSHDSSYFPHAFSYDGSTMINLGTLGGTNSQAHAINDDGQIVGMRYIASGQSHAFIYDEIEGMLDLNDLIATDSGWDYLSNANDINLSGQIVGAGVINGVSHAYLLTPALEPTALSVTLDIKPTSCPNPLNVNSNGVLPVAILGSDIFDVNDIDHNSILLEGISPIRMSLEDVAAPNTDPNDCICNSVGPDGYIDLSLKFDTQEIVAVLGEISDGDMWKLHLTGTLQDGTEIEGTDCIEIKKKGKK